MRMSAQKASLHSEALEQALSLAGTNRKSLENALKSCEGDTLRYQALRYLIENMPYHHTGGIIGGVDAVVDSLVSKADSKYYSLVSEATEEMQETDPLHRIIKETATQFANQLKVHEWKEPVVEENFLSDICSVDGNMLLRHVNYMCQLWRTFPSLQKYPFKCFLEYVLPYRSITDYPLVTSADALGNIYAKYLSRYAEGSIVDFSKCYNRTTWWLRHFGGNYPFDSSIGWKEMFFTGDFHDCVDKAFYAAQIYRACGWPAAVDYNIAYKVWRGKHYDLSVPTKPNGEWMSFSPETEKPTTAGSRFAQCLNIYRCHFSLQTNTPFFISEGKEPLPADLADPCLEDVSSSYTKTCQLVLPLSALVPASHKLVYLASFQPTEGWVPVTWGLVNRKKQVMKFSNVVTDNIYLPVCLNSEGNVVPLGKPFKLLDVEKAGVVVTQQSASYKELAVNIVPANQLTSGAHRVTLEISRKYPPKHHLVELAQRMVGAYIVASDDADFQNQDTLAVITSVPKDGWTDVALNSTRPYRYYRFCAPKSDPHMRLSEIRFLSDSKHAYKNTGSVEKIYTDSIDANWRWILDDTIENCRRKPEYDGNSQTAPERRAYVSLSLKEPQWVERVRIKAKNAENHVVAKHWYVLRRWTSEGWETVWQGQAQKHHLPPLLLLENGMYWLSDLTKGKEDLPFVVTKDGSISFVHEWIMPK